MKNPWLLRLLAFAGLAISLYLLTLKLTGRITYLVGCGEGSGCDNVLGSRWSQFFYVPVTALAATLYAILLAATFKPNRLLYAGLAIAFTGAALWFYGILLFELKAFCPWCAAAHLIGLTCAVLLFLTLRKRSDLGGNVHLGVVGGLFAVILLVLGQILGPIPATHEETTESLVEQPVTPPAGGTSADTPEDANVPVHARGKGRVVAFSDTKGFNTSSLPHLGSPDAPHVVVKYFDYTCTSCKDMHDDLKMVAGKHPGAFCMIMLPVPLHRDCNPHFPTDLKNHDHACELARLGLAAWRAKPEAFEEVHETLFTRPILEPEIAEIAVAQIVGEEALAKAREDPWIEEVLVADVNDFGQMVGSNRRMPKLLFGKDRVLHGLTNTPEALLRGLEQRFELTPAP